MARDSGPSILVRGLDPKTVQRLKAQARVNGRSLEQEIQEIFERAAWMLTMREAGKPVGYSRVAAGEGHAGLHGRERESREGVSLRLRSSRGLGVRYAARSHEDAGAACGWCVPCSSAHASA